MKIECAGRLFMAWPMHEQRKMCIYMHKRVEGQAKEGRGVRKGKKNKFAYSFQKGLYRIADACRER